MPIFTRYMTIRTHRDHSIDGDSLGTLVLVPHGLVLQGSGPLVDSVQIRNAVGEVGQKVFGQVYQLCRLQATQQSHIAHCKASIFT